MRYRFCMLNLVFEKGSHCFSNSCADLNELFIGQDVVMQHAIGPIKLTEKVRKICG